jgi:hypothetical protein
MLLVAILLTALLGQEDLDSLYRFKKDTTWTYKRIRHHGDHTHESQVIYKIIKFEGDTSEIDISTNGQGAPLIWRAEDGYLMYGPVVGKDAKMIFRAYKSGAKEGDTWDAAGPDLPEIPENASLTATHKGEKEVEVPAGKYNSTWVQIVAKRGDQAVTLDFYFVSGTGLIKYVSQTPWGGPDIIVLEKFVEGK